MNRDGVVPEVSPTLAPAQLRLVRTLDDLISGWVTGGRLVELHGRVSDVQADRVKALLLETMERHMKVRGLQA